MPTPPIAAKRPHVHETHADKREDPYYWLNQKTHPHVIAYLTAENQYFQDVMEPLQPFQEALYQDMLSHLSDSEESPPARHGPYYYYWRINPGRQYRTYYRKRTDSRVQLDQSSEELLLDINALAEGDAYLDVSTVSVSPDHTKLLYLENHDGSDRYTLYVTDLASHQILTDPIPNVFIGASTAWDAASSIIYYLTVDASQKPYRLIRRHIGSGREELLYEEQDPAQSLDLSTSMSGTYLFLNSASKTSSEVRYVSTIDPQALLKLFAGRRPDILYTLEHWQDKLLCLTNDQAENFQLLAAPIEEPSPEALVPLIPYDPARYLQEVIPFRQGLILSGRQDGLSQVWIYQDDQLLKLSWDEPVYTARPRFNRDYNADEVLVQYQSLITPPTDFAVNITTGIKTLVRRDDIKNYNPEDYQQRQIWVRAEDGTSIPVSIVARVDSLAKRPSPLLLYGYGSYGVNADPRFDITRLPMLDRGVIFAIAHVRGGSEMGYRWYQDGKLFNKRHTFTDFVDVAQFFVNEGYTAPHLMAAEGRSAGGLLMGAILNLRPDLFQVVAAGVPFVDVVTTMLDDSIPLTTLEWDEWGNPENPDYYHYMKSYSPYDNVVAQAYPHLYVTTGLNDPRVGYFEPAKWVAKLRDTKTDNHEIVFWTHMGSGHFGSSGRLPRIREESRELAFVLHQLGIQK